MYGVRTFKISYLTDPMLSLDNKIVLDFMETSCNYLLNSKKIYVFHKRKWTIKACFNKLYR